ncbi:hypothetical protein EDD16DRAFT_1712456 [Pisolithus croceorrhizus]|nr:hypothetical protein EDD16DRAFT_1712456 [Pisolithus croceorrhizus]
MALLAPPSDWHPPRDLTMDPASNSPSSRQRSSPSNDHNAPPHPQQPLPQPHQGQQPYPYPVQQQPQQQGPWLPTVSGAPFYPPFYQNQHPPQPYPVHPQSQNPYFDPATNAQLAQWAYQQMMFSQAQAQVQMPSRGTASAPASPADYYGPTPLFNPFPSGTPPPPQHLPQHHAPGYTQRTSSADGTRGQYEGFHPYRRPQQLSRTQEGDRWNSGSFQPPYARGDASASSTSVNSSSSSTGGNANPPSSTPRQRTSSMQGNGSAHQSAASAARMKSPPSSSQPSSSSQSPNEPGNSRPRTGSASGRPSSNPLPHHRTSSSSSTVSSAGTARPSVSSSATATSSSSSSSPPPSSSHSHSHSHPQARPSRPSPLSQGSTIPHASSNSHPQARSDRQSPAQSQLQPPSDKRMSRDDSDLATMLEGISIGAAPAKSGGIKGRLRRALSLGHALDEEQEREQSAVVNEHGKSASGTLDPSTSTDTTDASSTIANGGEATSAPYKKRSRAASLFSARLNASTDNISLSSTMSSASVVIRKIGSIGKLARRNSLAGITSLFKDKNKEKDQQGDSVNNNDSGGSVAGKKSKSKRSKDGKGSVLEPTISHAVAELDRTGSGSEWSDASLSGLSPAAKLARQHTLKSNAEAAAKARAQAEAQAQAVAQAQGARGANANGGSTNGDGGNVPVPATWEKSTATGRDGMHQGRRMVGEDGRVLVEGDSDSGSDVECSPHHQIQQQSYISDGWEDDEVWREEEDEEEDVTVRPGGSVEDEEVVEWAKTMRKTIERVKPAKGILKGAENFDQEVYIQDQVSNPAFSRIRSSSYSSHPASTLELGPLARIPSPDPDHIDGLHRHPSHSSTSQHGGGNGGITAAGGNSSSLVVSASASSDTSNPFSFEPESGRSSPHTSVGNSAHNGLFILSNSSAPALSTIPATATLPHRTSSAPATKRLVFASNLSVYDTFSSTVYDRRSEPATWSRLTPTLAQRIKEELNSYKMEEMEVHACSRVYTQFFI